MTTEIRNWAVVAALMEAQGATNSQMYIRAKALAEVSLTLCQLASLRLLSAFRLFEIKAFIGLTNRQALSFYIPHDKSPSFG